LLIAWRLLLLLLLAWGLLRRMICFALWAGVLQPLLVKRRIRQQVWY
jgi:hypothetical protein